MPAISIQTTQRVIPMVYAYSTPEIKRHDGHLKIGYTDRQTVEERVHQQGHTVDVIQKIEWKGRAIFDDESGETFTDHDFRAYLYKLGYERIDRTEYVRISVSDSKRRFGEYRMNHGVVEEGEFDTMPYTLRTEQQDAVAMTRVYAAAHPRGEFLWNAKPRFGKTLSVYDFVLRMDAKKVLIVTNRPAIANSWYADYEKFIGRKHGYFFVSTVEGIQDRPLVMSHDEYERDARSRRESRDARPMGLIEFVSLQDLKGSIHFGGEFRKLEHIATTTWDVLVIDEAHEGIDTYRTDAAFDRIRRNFTLHLSGTPFKALANDKFPADAIYNWTYADEQSAKRDWNGEGSNPYATLPRLNMFTYQMSEIIKDELAQGVEIEGEQREYAFDLNEFFVTNGQGRFVHESAVDKFLDALTTQTKFPFSTPKLRDELRHTFWLLNRVDSAKALMRKLQAHPVFRDYEVILAAGDGRMDGDDQAVNANAFKRVNAAIRAHDYTITLSVGQLTTGVTIPEWTAVLMLSSIRSPALYMQAAFRAQNPCLFKRDNTYLQKENAYVFDFDPARTLIIFEQFANDLSPNTVDGRGDVEARRENIRTLLNFFPVIGEDEGGEMVELDAEKVLSIPRRIKSREVVKSGFMNNYLFTDALGVIFHAPQELIDIITSFTPVEEPNNKANVTPDTADDLSIDDDGEVRVTDEHVIGLEPEIFGEKVYDVQPGRLEDIVPPPTEPTPTAAREKLRGKITDEVTEQIIRPVLDDVRDRYGSTFRKSDQNRVESRLKAGAEAIVHQHENQYHIEQKRLEQERDDRIAEAPTQEARDTIRQDYEKKADEARHDFMGALTQAITEFEQEAKQEAVRQAETSVKEAGKREQEDRLKDHLRGFSRTIPSFLMAYGDETVTLETFDQVIPDDVFREVTSIGLDDFRKLRDGGEYIGADGETHKYPGLFDKVVFNDSVKEFLRLREALADYFDEGQTEDIFDYIPPQKTNQIFTPKRVVKMMVDMLETENPGCFDRDDKTFIDLYMKSGLYIAEIVKRLYQSEAMKAKYPDREARLRHIFSKQVFGLAPTEIIYRIATRFILGFAQDVEIVDHNLWQFDALESAKEGTLEEELDRIFGN